MNKRGAGVVLWVTAAMLIAIHYLTTAIYLANVQTWSKEMFSSGLKYTGSLLDVLSALMFVMGAVYLFLAEKEALKP